MDDLIYWIWLSQACTPDTSTFPKLIEKFGSAIEIYNAEEYDISICVGHRNSDRRALLDKNLKQAENIYNLCKRGRIGIVPYCSPEYPKALKAINTPPVLLYYFGQWPDFDRTFAVSVVGTRALSNYGRKNAFKIAHDLADAGATVVSGMALGIDSVALAGAISAGKPVIAVWGSGINVCYPKEHRTLAQQIARCGCIITEYAPSVKPYKYNFPKRNRIISGLSAATLVIEGREKSGALITARYAKAQGRRIYALPGSVDSVRSELPNLLLKNGAKICTSADDIVNDYKDEYPGIINPFELKCTLGVDMMSELHRLRIVSNCPDDPIFTPPRAKSRDKVALPEIKERPAAVELNEPTAGFDAKSLAIYKKIPVEGKCSIESLADSEIPLKDVMRCMLKLEMGGFVSLLPGEAVCRKPK